MTTARDELERARAAQAARAAQLQLSADETVTTRGRLVEVAKLSPEKQEQLDVLVRRRDLRQHEEELARIEWMRLRKSKDRDAAIAAYHALDQAVKLAASARMVLRQWCSTQMGDTPTPQSFDVSGR